MAVTPSRLKYSMASGDPSPAYVPRRFSGSAGHSLEKPFTCTS